MDVASISENIFLQPKKILVIEDDKNMSVLIGRALLEMNSDIEIHWAVSLEQALTQLIKNTDINQKSPYTLIIVDIFLEGNGTGLDFFKVIRTTHPQIPFLMISSLRREQLFEALTDELNKNFTYLQKPFAFSECKEKIKSILSESIN